MLVQLTTKILNSTGDFLTSVSWRRGLSIAARDRGMVLGYHDHVIRSAIQTHRVPSEIILHAYVHLNYANGAPFSRENVYVRDNYTCQYCGEQCKYHMLTFDHVLPKSFGGKLTWENTVTACKRCNGYKEDRTPEQADMKLRNKPYRPTMKQLAQMKAKRAHG